MNPEIEWFCHHATKQELLTPEQCRAVADAMREAGVEESLQVFAQAVVDNELCTDVAAVEKIMGMAVEEARILGMPKESLFGISAPPPPAAPAFEPESPVRGVEESVSTPPADSAPVLDAIPVTDSGIDAGDYGNAEITATSEDLANAGWPDIGEVLSMTPAEAAALLREFLRCAREIGCSDVHISTGAYPFVRRHKAVHLLTTQPIITADMAERLNLAPLNPDQRETFEKTHDLDWAFAVSDTERYRVNLMLQRLGIAGSYRIIDSRIRMLQELGFPDPAVIEKLTTYHQWLILVTGPAGSGKTTTLGALIDLINRNRKAHIITIEDPIEIVHRPKGCNVTQREIGRHTLTFANSLRAALREDPDIIVIGELRDLETIEMAIRAAETGHLVIGTLHTGDASSTMDRILDVFPPGQQAQIRAMAAESLKGVICQQLLPRGDGEGVVLATEIMLGTLAVANIIREGETFKLPSVIQTSYNIGMRLMEQSIFDLYMAGALSYEQAISKIQNQDLIREMQANEARIAAEKAGVNKKKRGWFR